MNEFEAIKKSFTDALKKCQTALRTLYISVKLTLK